MSEPFSPGDEARFFALFTPYFDLEKQTAQAHTAQHYSLERMAELARLAGNPERALRIVHVAGTKGKGSTCFFLDALLRAAGRSCGVFTSPHLLSVRERFQAHGRPVAYGPLLAAAGRLVAAIRAAGLTPTLFEIMTVLALQLVREARCEWCVFEAGIGGLLDSTNYVPRPECCVITAISFDHTQLLGDTIAAIAAQKAGILKPGVPAVLGRQPYPEAETVVAEAARRLGCGLRTADQERPLDAWPAVLALPDFLQENFRTALAVLDVLGIRAEPARFELPPLPGRFQLLRRTPPVVIDAAHNADSARRLAAALAAAFPGVRFTVVLGVVQGKDVAGIFRELQPVAAEFVLTHPRNPGKGSELPALQRLAAAAGSPHRTLPELVRAEQLPGGAALLFTGSFFTALIGAELFGAAAPATAMVAKVRPAG